MTATPDEASADAVAAPRPRGVPRADPLIRPRFRGRELGLLLLVALTVTIGSVALGATQRLAAAGNAPPSLAVLFAPAGAGILAVYLGALLAAHLVFVIAGRRTDQVILPAVGLLGGI